MSAIVVATMKRHKISRDESRVDCIQIPKRPQSSLLLPGGHVLGANHPVGGRPLLPERRDKSNVVPPAGHVLVREAERWRRVASSGPMEGSSRL